MSLTIDVISDVVCPWCFVGKRRLEAALAEYARTHAEAPAPEIRWRAFELNPDLPVEGVDRQEHYQAKLGADHEATMARLQAVGRDAGIAFAFDRITRQPNTRLAHALIAAAPGPAVQEELVEGLFRAFFVDGVDLTQPRSLETIALRAGLEGSVVRSVLGEGTGLDRVAAEEEAAREIGVDGVPVFIFNHRYVVTGSQPTEVLLDAMRHAATAPEGDA
ncbi:MAG: DsbA family oxidoreductase [Acidobacteria bacterium]|jgi:predicted DsbA family dithiol-disulfide isomerase|nr:DsbA family oxidoreductase [Acidobacteriota bacterium]